MKCVTTKGVVPEVVPKSIVPFQFTLGKSFIEKRKILQSDRY